MVNVGKCGRICNSAMNSTTYNKIQLKYQTKLRVYYTKVKAVLLHGCETWENSKCTAAAAVKLLYVFIKKCLRKILKFFWLDRIMNEDFYINGSVHRESILIIVQQDATYSVYYISVGSSTCFGC